MFEADDTANAPAASYYSSSGRRGGSSCSSGSRSDQIEVDLRPTMSTQQPQHHYLVGPDPIGGVKDGNMTKDPSRSSNYAYEGDLYLGLQSLSDIKPPSKQTGLKDPPPSSLAGLKKEDSSIESSEDSDQLFIFIKRAPFRPKSLQGRSDKSPDSRRNNTSNSATNLGSSNSSHERRFNTTTCSQSSSLSSNSDTVESPVQGSRFGIASDGRFDGPPKHTPSSSGNSMSATNSNSHMEEYGWPSHLNATSYGPDRMVVDHATTSNGRSSSAPTHAAVSFDDVVSRMDGMQVGHHHQQQHREEALDRDWTEYSYEYDRPSNYSSIGGSSHELSRASSLNVGVACVGRSATSIGRVNNSYEPYQREPALLSHQSQGHFSPSIPIPEAPRRAVSAVETGSGFHGFTHSLLNQDANKSRILREYRGLSGHVLGGTSREDEASKILETAKVELTKLAPSQSYGSTHVSPYHKSLIEEMDALERRYEWAEVEEDRRSFQLDELRRHQELSDSSG